MKKINHTSLVEEFNHTPLLRTDVHDRSRFLRLSRHQYLQQRDEIFRILTLRYSHYNNAMRIHPGPLRAK